MNNPRVHSLIAFMVIFSVTLNATADEQTKCPPALTGLKSSIWQSLEIPVCWENPSPADETQRGWVRQAVQDTWERHSALRFSGWGACSPSTRGIRISVEDTGPHAKGLGNQLDGKPQGMVLNFSFENWSPVCHRKLEYCIRNIAVHEFGHALGFAHEANRPDAPEECHRDQSQGTNGDILITPYDLHSVMNYCNPQWGGDGQLSDNDIAGLKSWYGTPQRPASRYDGAWQGKLSYSDPDCIADPVSITINGQQVQGRLRAADGQVVEAQATIDENSKFDGLTFRVTYPSRNHFVDVITLRGAITGGTLQSTDCGCGQYFFSRR